MSLLLYHTPSSLGDTFRHDSKRADFRKPEKTATEGSQADLDDFSVRYGSGSRTNVIKRHCFQRLPAERKKNCVHVVPIHPEGMPCGSKKSEWRMKQQKSIMRKRHIRVFPLSVLHKERAVIATVYTSLCFILGREQEIVIVPTAYQHIESLAFCTVFCGLYRIY